MAIGALRALREAGLRVPQDVAVIGVDDIPFAALTEPALTTVRQPVARLGETAAGELIEMLHNPDRPASRIILPTELVLRASA
jgi:LacI family transcriptional regulator